ncbi:MAG: hypothetical protein PHU63_01395 [Candidatus ainarchaeum sp.]|nr:hypothetical protein [Candidatus ainarchaeum sp.]
MNKEKIKQLIMAGYKGAKLGLSQEDMFDLVENSFSPTPIKKEVVILPS